MKTSRCGFCYSACRRRERFERQGSSPRCCGVCVLIRLVLLHSFWHFPSTPAPVSLSFSVSSPGLSQTFSSPTRLSSILCWHRQTAPSVTRLINSCSPILSATAGRARALSHARSRTSSESKFPMQRQPTVCQFTHFDMFWRVFLLLVTATSGLSFCPCNQMIRWTDFGVCWPH